MNRPSLAPSLLPLLLLSALLSATQPACRQEGPALPLGEATDGCDPRPVGELLDRAGELEGREVCAEGEVGQVCRDMGCWFTLRGDGREILVDLEMGRRFVVPVGIEGLTVRVRGELRRVGPDPRIIGRGVAPAGAGAQGGEGSRS